MLKIRKRGTAMKEQSLNRITLILLYAVMAVGLLFTISLPWALPRILRLGLMRNGAYWGSLGLWMGGCCLGLCILGTLAKMMHSLSGDPFGEANILRLRRMGFLALGMVACTVLAAFLHFRPLYMAVAAVELLCGLFSLVLRGVFARAVAFKQENDLTI